ncbi:isopeptide-forming domain-containing fimbrial protein [Bacillus cereus]|uniref:Isopeptide-forming domain-containing fimbrial protein n=1 Tax=Bacillus cereus TaxID=1396 RepID=A0A9W7QFZ5_BACCE|nr:isopeptide-forming domain-containing fimbrial protein [Bacillus cereus]KAB2410281.1 isopeptide-forming domain-containing fimbrial protein [Bacillus cereus]KAB2428716.1 isopeptide-forming domain-containing fimbrial protein [Bacillus cereus]
MFSSQVPSYSFSGKNIITAFNKIGTYHLQAIGGSNVFGYDVSNDPKIKGKYIDSDNDSSTFSSSAMEYVPNGAIESAFLYILPNSVQVTKDGQPGTFIQGPKGGRFFFEMALNGVYDITDFVKQEGAGQYWGKNLILPNPLSIPWGGDALANWDIVFVEKNESLPPMMTKLNYYFGSRTDNPTTLSEEPFLTKQEGSLKGSMVASVYGGNQNIGNDQYKIIAYKDNQVVNESYMSDSTRDENNFWNGNITKNGKNISTRNPNRTPANTDIFNYDFTDSPYFPAGIDRIDQIFTAKPINANGSVDGYSPHFWGVALEVMPPKKNPVLESEKIAKNLQNKNIEVGDEIEYTIKTRNTVSDSIVKNAVIEDQLPEGLEYVPGTLQVNGKPVTDAEGDDNGHYVQGKFTGQLGDITDTEWHTVVFHAKVKAGQAGQDIQNTAKVTGENVPPQEPSTTVEVYPRNPKVESKKTAKNLQDKNIEVGDEIEYTIQMRNTISDSIVKNAVIEDQLPEALEYVPGTLQVNGQAVTDAEGDDTGHYVQGKVTGQLGDITDTEWHTVVFHAKVKAGQEGTAIQNTAKVTGENVPPQEPTTEIKVQPLGQIEIEKVDAVDSTIKLKNAVFQIIDKNGKEVGKLTTDENGKATSELLLLGKYTVKEIKAPDGYMLLKDPIEVEVSSPLHKITVENTKNGWNIPHTGGIGTTLFYLIGIIVMVGALVVFFRKRVTNK